MERSRGSRGVVEGVEGMEKCRAREENGWRLYEGCMEG